MKVQYNVLRSLIIYETDYNILQAIFIIEQYILARTNKKISIKLNNIEIEKFERAITIAHNYFKLTYKKLWQ